MNIEKYNNHQELIPFYVARGLEIEEEFENTPIFSLIMKDEDNMIGAVTCSKIDESFVIEAIVIVEEYQNKGYGRELLEKAINEIKNIGEGNIYLVAKNTVFFEKNNFEIIDREEAPSFAFCFVCPQYQIKCFPQAMKYQGVK